MTVQPAGGIGVSPLPPALHLALTGGALLLAAALAATGRPLIAAGVLVTGVVAVAMLARPWVALAVLLVVNLTNAGTVVGERGGRGLSAVMLLLAIGSVVRSRDARAVRAVLESPVVRLAALWLCVRAVSGIGAADLDASVASVIDAAKALVFLVVVAMLTLAAGRYVGVAKVAVVVLAGLAAVTVVQQFALHNSTTLGGFSNLGAVSDVGAVSVRHSGPLSDANFWGRLLVLYLPLALSLLVIVRGPARVRWAVAPPVLLAGLVLTGSRGAMIAGVLAVALWLVLAGPRFRRLLLLLPALAVVVALVPGTGSRVATLTDLTDPSAAGTDLSLVNRLAAQKAGMRMFLEHPVLGVGAGNFVQEAPEYLRKTGNLEFTEILGPHNTYLEMAAEGGILTLVAWLLFYGAAMYVAARAYLNARAIEPPVGPRAELLAAGALVGLVAWAAASVFLHVSALSAVFAVMALAVALDVLTRKLAERAPRSGGPRRAAPPARRVRRVTVGALLIATFVAAGGAYALGQRWTASAAGVVVPNPRLSHSGRNAYDFDTLARALVVPTFAAVVADGRFKDEAQRGLRLGPTRERVAVRVQPAPASAVITVTAKAADRRVAAGMARGILNGGMRFVARTDGLYVIRAAAPGEVRNISVHREAPPAAKLAYAVAVLLGLATILVAAAGLGPFAGRRRGRR
jgi:O-antigen ligase